MGQMGGSVAIQSETGVGTRFVIRLPFTVSVNRALMVRVGEDLYAVPLNNIQGIVRAQVDSLLGSREIVVKTLGPQFSSVMGVSGGTILGDGNVVIILDLPAMIRTQASLEYQQAKLLDSQEAERRHELENRLPRVLVVDDSVTVRKVTTRLLERNGIRK